MLMNFKNINMKRLFPVNIILLALILTFGAVEIIYGNNQIILPIGCVMLTVVVITLFTGVFNKGTNIYGVLCIATSLLSLILVSYIVILMCAQPDLISTIINNIGYTLHSITHMNFYNIVAK